jgi:chromosomal replication initiation ATPase DnaA
MTYEPITAETMGASYITMQMQNGGVLRNMFNKRTSRRIIAEVARDHGITPDDIMGECRRPEFAWPRHEAMRQVYQETGLSFSAIGRIFGRDHTTVMNGVKRAQARFKAVTNGVY